MIRMMFGTEGHTDTVNVILFIAPDIINGGRAGQVGHRVMPETVTAQSNMVQILIKEMRVADQCGLHQRRLL
jgi:hypothetical protein